MKEPFIRGKFKFEDEKKKKKKKKKKNYEKLKLKAQEKLKEKDKKLRKMCECNHLDSKKNKAHFEKIDNGEGGVNYLRCQICGGKLINDEKALSEPCLEQAYDALYTAVAYIRNRFPLEPQMDKALTTTLFMNRRAITLLKKMKKENLLEKKNDKKGKKNKKKNKKKRLERIAY